MNDTDKDIIGAFEEAIDHAKGVEAVARAIGRTVWGSEVEPKGNWLEAGQAAITAYREHLEAEGMDDAESLNALFDLQWKADQRAVKMWREANPGNDLVMPGRTDMVVWLLEEMDNLASTIKAHEEQ
tara:strand:+ start:504 stop:884 length:381 start_codon:yes stop_codon:yes gene_type:complete